MYKVYLVLSFLIHNHRVTSHFSKVTDLKQYKLQNDEGNSSNLDTEKDVQVTDEFCSLQRGRRIDSRAEELLCCKATSQYFTREWFQGRLALTEYLETLKDWNCSQFQQECNKPTFNFTDFTSKVYLRACNYQNFIDKCYDTVKSFTGSLKKQINQERRIAYILVKILRKDTVHTRRSVAEWKEAISDLMLGEVRLPVPPCVQVALYDKGNKYDSYKEIVKSQVPFCHVSWCGVDAKSSREQYTAAWACLSTGCRSGVIFSIVLTSLLSFLILISSGTVVVVFWRNKHLRNSQGIYKISLSIADFFIGGLVLPSFAINIGRNAFMHDSVGDPYKDGRDSVPESFAEYFNTSYGTATDSVGLEVISSNISHPSETSNGWKPKSILEEILTKEFVHPIGFFTMLAITASVYSLTIASFDRLSVVRYPLKYNTSRAKTSAIRATVCLWVVVFVLSCLPFFVQGLRFGLVASVLICLTGRLALYIYTVAMLFPVLLMWMSTIATCCYSYKNARQRLARDFTIEFRLTRTLFVMVVVFTCSLLPAIVALVGSLLSTGIYLNEPATLNTTAEVYFVSFEFIAVIFLVCNSSWNFLIYNARNDSFRKATKSLFSYIPRSILLASDV